MMEMYYYRKRATILPIICYLEAAKTQGVRL